MNPSPPPEPPNLTRRFWMAVGLSCVFVGVLVLLDFRRPPSVGNYDAYGYWMFLGLPFLQGLSCSFWLEREGPVLFRKHLAADMAALLFLTLVLLLFAYEGLICIMMAFPIAAVASITGSGLAYGVMTLVHRRRNVASVSLFALAPCLLIADSLTGGKPSPGALSTEMIINATPEQIWPYLQNLDSVATDFWLFDSGMAHPVNIRTLEAKVGGARECVLSTGVMHETISEFVPGRRLAFRMLNTPPSMKELNPFGEVHAAHLKGYYESLEGSFDLIPLSDGRTLVRGTSVFRHRFRPVTYWTWWTDLVVRNVHLSVLREVKRRVER